MTAAGPPPNPRVGRQRFLTRFLSASVVVAFGLAVAGLVLPGDAGATAGRLLVAVLVAVPAVRVGWLVVRWLRLGDIRFASAGLALLGVLAVAVLVAR